MGQWQEHLSVSLAPGLPLEQVTPLLFAGPSNFHFHPPQRSRASDPSTVSVCHGLCADTYGASYSLLSLQERDLCLADKLANVCVFL